jgi:hypothetical protein
MPHEDDSHSLCGRRRAGAEGDGSGTDSAPDAADKLFQDHDNTTDPAAKVQGARTAAKALLSDRLRIFRSSRSLPRKATIENAIAASRSGELFQYLTAPPLSLDFPVDTWLYGVAACATRCTPGNRC